jgi:MoaA/NifB/PqqE/SkfB family radical SAM enzyme
MAGLLTGTYNPAPPWVVDVEITNRCNMQCPWCHWHAPTAAKSPIKKHAKRDMELELFIRLCRELSAMGTREMQFIGGGEGLLHPRFPEFTHEAKSQGFHLLIFTNGSLFDQERVQQLLETGVDEVRVSLWGASRDEYGLHYGPGGRRNFDRIVSGLDLLNQSKESKAVDKPRVSANYILVRQSRFEQERLLALARDLHLQELIMSVVHAPNRVKSSAAYAPSRKSKLEEAGRLPQLAAALKSQGTYMDLPRSVQKVVKGMSAWKEMTCNVGWFYSFISLVGEVKGCQRCNYVLGDVNTTNFRQIWNSPAYRRFRELSRNRRELNKITGDYGCQCCCHLSHNIKIDRILRWWPLGRGRNYLS